MKSYTFLYIKKITGFNFRSIVLLEKNPSFQLTFLKMYTHFCLILQYICIVQMNELF